MAGIGKALGGKRAAIKDDSSGKQDTSRAKSSSQKISRAEEIERGAANTHNQWLSSENNNDGPKTEVYIEEDIPLGSILLDKENHRTRHINVAKPTENLLPEDHPDYQKNQELIENLKEFAEHLRNEPLRQQPGVYRESGKVYMAYGHRRFLALLIAYGPKFVYRFKVYPSKPKDLAKARFQENVQRVDVPLSDKILDFKDAQEEAVSILRDENESISVRSVSNRLGVGVSTYSILDRATKKDFLLDLIEKGEIKEYSVLRSVINTESREEALSKLSGEAPKPSTAGKKVSRGRPKKYVQFPKITNKDLLKKIIDGKLSEFEWQEEDFESYDSITLKLNECIEILSSR